jgi:hypothetical protein
MSINLPLPQVTRIPITGPAPYNTLVCVQTTSNGGPQTIPHGKLWRYPVTVPTKFRLAGFDQRVVPVFEHSTTAYISSIGPAEDDTWLYAVDEVTGAGFDQVDGSFFVNLNLAIMPAESISSECVTYGDPSQGGFIVCNILLTLQVTSYILCFEPPLPAPVHSIRHRAPAAHVSKIPERQAVSLSEQAARQLGLPFLLNPKLDSPATSSLGKCDCKRK